METETLLLIVTYDSATRRYPKSADSSLHLQTFLRYILRRFPHKCNIAGNVAYGVTSLNNTQFGFNIQNT
jgi:hypothetical protein